MSEKLPISLVVITLNEEKNLERCLRAADFCSEIIVVDSGSTDRTTEIARKFNARVLHREWTGYGDQKNHGSEQASNDWVLCIDADEVVSEKLRSSIVETFKTQPHADAFLINRHSYYANRLINHSGWYPQWRMFLYRKGKAHWGGDEPHAVVIFTGKRSLRLYGDLFHYTYSGFRDHVRKTIRAASDAAEAMYERGRRAGALDLIIRPPCSALRCYILQAGFLDGFAGLCIGTVTAFYTFSKYAMLKERWRSGAIKKKAQFLRA